MQSNLNVSGAGAFTGAVSLQSNLNVTGAVSLQSNLNVTGLATISGAAIQSNASVGGILTVPTVSSLTTLNGTINFLTPVGTITMYCAGTAPTGWLICDGTSYLRSAYPALSAIIGSNFGGNPTNFNVPDLRSRFPIGTSTIYPLATTSGSATYTLTSNNLPVHNHGASATSSVPNHNHGVNDPGHSHSDRGHRHNYYDQTVNRCDVNGTNFDYQGVDGVPDNLRTSELGYADLLSNTTGISIQDRALTITTNVTVNNSTNANNAFSILNPCISVNYIIKF